MSDYEIFDVFDEKIDDFLNHIDPIFQVVPGNSFGFFGATVASLAVIISFILYISVDPTFTIFTHWISHLGAGPNGSNIVFNIGISITSFLLFLFYMYFIKEFRKKGANKYLLDVFFISSIGTTLGLLFVAFFPYDIVYLHSTAAFIFFFSGLISCSLYAIIILTTKGTHKIQAIFAFIVSGFFFFHLISSIMIAFSSELYIGIAVFSEWLTLFAMIVLIIETGFYHITEKKLFYKQLANHVIDNNHKLNNSNIMKLRKFIKSLHHKKHILI
ncbi:MAG: hypothetical protein ACFFBP_21020 [Promethearchaeota archaeon]